VIIDPAFGSEIPLDSLQGEAQPAAHQLRGSPSTGELVGCDTYVIEFLAHCERYAVSVEERAPPGWQHYSLGSLSLGLFRPPLSLH
jgi:hypothetical protein